MPHFTRQLEPNGPIINLGIGVSSARAQALKDAGENVPQVVSTQGLVDTGASITCVDQSIISSLGVIKHGEMNVLTPSTQDEHVIMDQYDIALVIPSIQGESPHIIPVLPVVESTLVKQGFHALIGRDVLSKCMLVYNGQRNQFTLAF